VRIRHDVDDRRLTALERRVVAARNATTSEESTTDDRFPFP
jgi:hypothetical protein